VLAFRTIFTYLQCLTVFTISFLLLGKYQISHTETSSWQHSKSKKLKFTITIILTRCRSQMTFISFHHVFLQELQKIFTTLMFLFFPFISSCNFVACRTFPIFLALRLCFTFLIFPFYKLFFLNDFRNIFGPTGHVTIFTFYFGFSFYTSVRFANNT
jgi:hypothetical protein